MLVPSVTNHNKFYCRKDTLETVEVHLTDPIKYQTQSRLANVCKRRISFLGKEIVATVLYIHEGPYVRIYVADVPTELCLFPRSYNDVT